MDWIQLITAIVGSSVLTAIVTGIFDFVTIKETNKENNRQRKFDSNSKTLHEEKLKKEQNQHQKAENLYKIISPAIKCEALRIYIKNPEKYNFDAFKYLYEEINEDYGLYSEYTKWLNQAKFKLKNPGDIDFQPYVKNLIRDDLERQYNLTEFFQRYNKGTHESVKIDVEKLNNDIEFVNEELNLYIEKF